MTNIFVQTIIRHVVKMVDKAHSHRMVLRCRGCTCPYRAYGALLQRAIAFGKITSGYVRISQDRVNWCRWSWTSQKDDWQIEKNVFLEK